MLRLPVVWRMIALRFCRHGRCRWIIKQNVKGVAKCRDRDLSALCLPGSGSEVFGGKAKGRRAEAQEF